MHLYFSGFTCNGSALYYVVILQLLCAARFITGEKLLREISGSHSGVVENSSLLCCYALPTAQQLKGNVMPSTFKYLLGLLDPDNECTTIFRNVVNLLPVCTLLTGKKASLFSF
jgi:hypothetical protein